MTAVQRSPLLGLSLASLDVGADRAPLPPPALRVPAVPPPTLPLLNDQPIVPVAQDAAPPFPLASEPVQPATDVGTPPGVERSANVIAESSMIGIPSLPTGTAARPSAAPVTPSEGGPGGHHPSQAGRAVTARVDETPPSASPKSGPRPAPGRWVARTLAFALLAGGIGAGANIGYDYWQGASDNVAAAEFDGTRLETWPHIEPPQIRYVDSTTQLRSEAGSRTIVSHTDLVGGDRLVDLVDTDPVGIATEYTGDEAAVLAGAPIVDGAFTVSEVLPKRALPFITVIEAIESQLPVGPITLARAVPGPADGPLAPRVGTEMWQYRVNIDTEAFRIGDPVAYETWSRLLGSVAVARLDVWVDGTGVVRQIVADVAGTNVVYTIVSAATESTRFAAPDAAAIAVTAEAADAAEPTDVVEASE